MNKRHPHWSQYIRPDEGNSLKNRPFENLADLFKTVQEKKKEEKSVKPPVPKEKRQRDKSERELFLEAMKGVRPINDKEEANFDLSDRETCGGTCKKVSPKEARDLREGIRELAAVIRGERPLPVEKIPEYMDGPCFNMDRGLVRKLRRGQFAIQAYCELHGLRADEALQVMDGFMSDALMNNRRAIAFIHGRGKSSPGEPVLKGLVKDFLNRGRFRRYVLAYSSAPSWDGGPGVTYVLLRKRPVRKTKKR